MIKPRHLLKLFAIFIIIGLFLVPIPDVLSQDLVIYTLGNLVHIPLFFVISYLISQIVGDKLRFWWIAALALFLGGVLEFLQSLLGRETSMLDLINNLVGIGCFSFFIYFQRNFKLFVLSGLLIFVIVVQLFILGLPEKIFARNKVAGSFPVLSDFEDPSIMALWAPFYESSVEFKLLFNSDLGRNSVLEVSSGPSSYWPGGVMEYFPRNWSGYKELVFEVRLVGVDSQEALMGVRLEDIGFLEDGESYYQNYLAESEWQIIRVNLTELRTNPRGRAVDLRNMITLKVYFVKPETQFIAQIDNVRLEKLGLVWDGF